MIEELQLLGLTQNESKVYEALVQTGPTKAGHLIARLDVHRNIVYEALESLIRKGFITKISKRGVWWFQITEPDSLLTSLRRREEIAEQVIQQVKQYKHQVEQQITVYEGVDSYRAYWLTSLERFPMGTIDYCVGVPSHTQWVKLLGVAGVKKYMDLRLQKKIFWKTLHFEITNEEKELMQKYPELTEYRLWPRKHTILGNFNVIHDTVILQAMTDLPRIIEIRDSQMVSVFKTYFDAMWEQAQPVVL